MSHRKRVIRERTYDEEPPQQYTWIVYAVGMLLVGGLAGYVLSTATGPQPGATAPVTQTLPTSDPGTQPGLVNEAALASYRNILARDPKNFQAAVDAGNLLYDARRYSDAIPYYQQAMGINGTDVNVSTDLGTALWYTGNADAALAQYEVSLRLAPDHAQTLFNVGIVKADGKRDFNGAVQAWEALLQKNPSYPNAASVRTLLADARAKAGAAN